MRIRPLHDADLPFLREMLYAAAFWRAEGDHPPFELAMEHPYFRLYHAGWGRTGDTGVVAEEDGGSIGAVWYRFFTEDSHGEGFVDEDTPELAIAVSEGHRGKGVGRALLEAIHERARNDGFRQIALSVNSDNPAKLLYFSVGYRDYRPDTPGERMLLQLDP